MVHAILYLPITFLLQWGPLSFCAFLQEMVSTFPKCHFVSFFFFALPSSLLSHPQLLALSFPPSHHPPVCPSPSPHYLTFVYYIIVMPKLSLRHGDATANNRTNAVNKETVEQYCGLLKEVLEESGLMNSPTQIYNVHESGKPLDPRTLNVIARKGSIVPLAKRTSHHCWLCQCYWPGHSAVHYFWCKKASAALDSGRSSRYNVWAELQGVDGLWGLWRLAIQPCSVCTTTSAAPQCA